MQLDIIDVRHFNARQLRALLTEEANLWQRRLRWDYRASTDLLLSYLDSRILPGYVALRSKKICGYTFCVYEGHKAVIGDLFASTAAESPLTVSNVLAQHMLETLIASPEVTRLETQLMLFDPGSIPPAFALAGFKPYLRLFMEREVLRAGSPGTPALADGIAITPWVPALYQPAAQLIQECYIGHVDAEVNDQYKTLAGCLRFLHNVIRFPGCGTFDASSSWALIDPRTQRLEGILLCSRVAADTAHITQLCIRPRLRGLGLGHALLSHCMDRLYTRRYRFLGLTVTAANTSAVRLYDAAAFRTRHQFEAAVLIK